MRLIYKILIGVVVFIVVAVVALILSIDGIAKYAIDHAGTSELGVKTHVDHVGIGLVSGHSTIRELTIANPPGYNSNQFLELKSGTLDASLSNLLGSEVDIDLITLSGINLDIEQNEKGFNYKTIMDHASGSDVKSTETGKTTGTKSTDGKKFHIKRILIEDVTIKANLLGALGKVTEAKIPIKKLEIKDVGTDNEGVLLSKLTVLIIEALLQATAEAGIKDLPKTLLGDLGKQLGSSSGVSLSGFAIDTGKGLSNIGSGIINTINATGKGAGDAGKSIGDALQGVFGDKKEKEKKEEEKKGSDK